jgi:pimeloyl-ACP methyl ester carboxylesterase
MFRSLVPATLSARPHGEPSRINHHRWARFLPPQELDQSRIHAARNEVDMRTSLQHPRRRQPLLGFPVLFGLLVVLALAAVACSATSATRTDAGQPGSPGQGRLVDIGDRRLNLECQGTGTPPVVFVAGLGDSGETAWGAVWDQVARSARACVYDRAGLGRSDPSPHPATYQSAVDDLHALLHSAHVAGPYVLVGHSLGGLLTRLYAHRHPAEVAGVVLVDATPVDWFPTVQRLLPAEFLGPLEHNPEGFDLRHGLASLTALDTRGTLGDRPLAAMWAPNQPPAGLPAAITQELGRRWEAEQARLGRLSAASHLQRVAAGGHYLQRDQPQLVLDAINQTVRAAQRAAAAR